VGRIELLDLAHDRAGFDCGVEALNRYLHQIARQHIAKGISKTFVLIDEPAATPRPVLGYFTISLCQVIGAQVPTKWAAKLPELIPAMRLGRLAVSKMRQGEGIGKALLIEALYRCATVADLAGGIGLFVDAKDDAAAAFYKKFGFEPTPTAILTLFMPMETIRQVVTA
jgi:GNAT superfamily N-acetyltransferase